MLKTDKMLMQYLTLLVYLLTPNISLCASAAVHSHSVDTPERESDGAYRPRDYDHYTNAGHNVEFDHEAILGTSCRLYVIASAQRFAMHDA